MGIGAVAGRFGPSGFHAGDWMLFLRFAAVGLLNTAFGYAAFALLLVAGVWPGAALIAATIAGVAFNFQTSRRLVFRSHGLLLRFLLLYATAVALNWVALRLLTGFGVSPFVAQAVLTVPLAVLSFAGQKAFVFRRPAGQRPPTERNHGH